MTSLFNVLFLVVPFLAAQVKADTTSSLQFVYPQPGRFDYEYAKGDQVIIEWQPKVQLSELYVNCSGINTIEGKSGVSGIEFTNTDSGAIYHPPWTEEIGQHSYCTFCAGPEAGTCSGVFHLTNTRNESTSKLWSSKATVDISGSESAQASVVLVTKTTTQTDFVSFSETTTAIISSLPDKGTPESTLAKPTKATSSLAPLISFGQRPSSTYNFTVSLPPTASLPAYTAVSAAASGPIPNEQLTLPPFYLPSYKMATSTLPKTTALPPLITYGQRNSSAPTFNVTLPPTTSLAPYIQASGPGTAVSGPYTTITASLQGWNATSTSATSNGVTTLVQTIPIPTTPFLTPSLAPAAAPSPTVSASGASGLLSTDSALVALFIVGIGAFVML